MLDESTYQLSFSLISRAGPDGQKLPKGFELTKTQLTFVEQKFIYDSTNQILDL